MRSESSRMAGENSSIATTECSFAPPTPFDVHRALYSAGYGEGNTASGPKGQGGHRHASSSAVAKQAKSNVKTSAQMEPSVFTALRKSGLEVVEFLLGDFVRDQEIFVRKLLSCCSSAVKEVRLYLFYFFDILYTIYPAVLHQAMAAAGRPHNNLFSPNVPLRTAAAIATWNDGKRLGRALFHRMLQKLLRLLGCSDPLSSSQARLLSRKAADELFQQLRAMEGSDTKSLRREADGDGDDDSTVSPMRLVPLLRKAEGEFRRSFDSRCSQTALGVLFWRREDAPPKVVQSEQPSPSNPKSNPRGGGASSGTAVVFGLPTARDGDLAELLGGVASPSSNKAPGQCLGRFHMEQWQGGADGVAAALNSPLRRASSVNNNRKVRLDKDSAPTLHSQPNLFDSKEFLRGGQVRELILRGGREEPPPPPSPQQQIRSESSRRAEGDVTIQGRIFRGRPHTLRQEFINDKTAVSDALGSNNRHSPGW